MHVILKPSPSVTHRYRVTLPCKRSIDFGKNGVDYYVDHGNPRIMRAQLLRKGAILPKEVRIERDPYEIHRGMLKVKESTMEDWDTYLSQDFWERWLLMSYPDMHKSKLWMATQEGVLFMPVPKISGSALIPGRTKTTLTSEGFLEETNLLNGWSLTPL